MIFSFLAITVKLAFIIIIHTFCSIEREKKNIRMKIIYKKEKYI